MAIDDNASYELTGYQVKDLAQKIRAKADSNSLASVATSGLYSDLTGAPTIPTVYNGTLTIQQNGTQLGTFSANQSSNTTINITGGGSSGAVFYQGISGDVVTLYSDQAKTQVATAQDVADAVVAGATYISYGVDELASVVFCLPVPGATGQYLFRATTGTFVMELIATSTTTFVQSNINVQEELNAGSNISISGNTISATDTTYSDFTGATSSVAGANGLVPAPAAGDETKVLHGDGTWKDTTAKLVEMSYGESNAWAKFIAAYNAGSIVYCRASSNSNPGTGSQTRKAFMAYVNNATNPTNVEFQYVRSQSSKTDSQQCDQVFVYTLTNASGGTWSVASRNMGPKINVDGPITKTFTTGANATITIGASAMTGATSGTAGTAGVVPAPAAGDQNKVLKGDGTWVSQGEEFIGEFTTGSSFTLPAGYKIYHIRGFAQYSGASSNAGMWMTRTNRTGTDWLRRINGSAGGVQWGEWSYTDGHFVLLGASDALTINGGKVMVDLTITVTNSTLWITSGNFSHSGSQDSGVVFSETTTSDASADTTLQFASTGRTFQAMDIIVTGIKQ